MSETSKTGAEANDRRVRRGPERHPEKRNRADSPIQKKPDWIRVKAPTSPVYAETKKLVRELKLNTVCE